MSFLIKVSVHYLYANYIVKIPFFILNGMVKIHLEFNMLHNLMRLMVTEQTTQLCQEHWEVQYKENVTHSINYNVIYHFFLIEQNVYN